MSRNSKDNDKSKKKKGRVAQLKGRKTRNRSNSDPPRNNIINNHPLYRRGADVAAPNIATHAMEIVYQSGGDAGHLPFLSPPRYGVRKERMERMEPPTIHLPNAPIVDPVRKPQEKRKRGGIHALMRLVDFKKKDKKSENESLDLPELPRVTQSPRCQMKRAGDLKAILAAADELAPIKGNGRRFIRKKKKQRERGMMFSVERTKTILPIGKLPVKKRLTKKKSFKKKIMYPFVYNVPPEEKIPRKVLVIGSFNHFERKISLKQTGQKRCFMRVLTISPGTCKFRYIVDGKYATSSEYQIVKKGNGEGKSFNIVNVEEPFRKSFQRKKLRFSGDLQARGHLLRAPLASETRRFHIPKKFNIPWSQDISKLPNQEPGKRFRYPPAFPKYLDISTPMLIEHKSDDISKSHVILNRMYCRYPNLGNDIISSRVTKTSLLCKYVYAHGGEGSQHHTYMVHYTGKM